LELTKDKIALIQKRDRRFIMELYAYCFPFMLQRLARLSLHKEDQMSIANTAFLKALDRIETFDLQKSFPAFLSVIVRNEFIDQYRKKQRYHSFFQQVDSTIDLPDSVPTDLILQQEDAAKMLFEFVDALPDASRVIFNLYVIEELTREEIAQELGISYDLVKWHILKARKLIAEQLQNRTS
jgi:RNA polymerase sigma factor (sigma-70 family)